MRLYNKIGALQPRDKTFPYFSHYYLCIKPLPQRHIGVFHKFHIDVGQIALVERYGKKQQYVYIQKDDKEYRLPPGILRKCFKRL